MADEQKTSMIYSVKLDIEATNKALAEYAANLQKVKAAQADGTAQSKASEEQTKRTEEAVRKSKVAIEAEAESIAALRKENQQLTALRNATTTATEEGRKKIEGLNKLLDENNDKIKENVDAYTKQKMGIGDYSGALDKLVPGLGSTTKGMMAMGKEMWALVANPLGATLAAIGLAFGALMAYFKGSEEGQNNLNKIMTVGSIIMEKLMDIAEFLGEKLFKAFTSPKEALMDLVDFIKNNLINRFTALGVIIEGIIDLDFKKMANGVLQMATGVEDVIGKVTDLAVEVTNTFNEAIKQGEKLADFMADIDKKEREMITERAKVSLEVSKLKAKSVHEEGEQKRATIEAAIALEEGLAEKELELAKIKLAQADLTVKARGDDKEALNAQAEAVANVAQAEQSKFDATIRFQKQLEALDEEDKAARLKSEKEFNDHILDMMDASWEEQEKARKERKKKDDAQKEKDLKASAAKEVEIEKVKAGGITGIIDQVTGKRVDSQSLYNSVFKAGALKETMVNTWKGAEAAFSAMAGIPIVGPALGLVAGAAAFAFGLAQAAGIGAIGFATGGRSKPVSGTRINANHGLPISRSNGDNLLATIAIDEVILNRDQQARLGGDAAFRAAGVPGFASGGASGSIADQVEMRLASNLIDPNSMLDIMQSAIRGIRPVLILQDFEAVQGDRDAVEARSVVI